MEGTIQKEFAALRCRKSSGSRYLHGMGKHAWVTGVKHYALDHDAYIWLIQSRSKRITVILVGITISSCALAFTREEGVPKRIIEVIDRFR